MNADKLYFNLEKSRFGAALWLDNVFSKKIRRGIAKGFNIIIIFSLVAIAAIWAMGLNLKYVPVPAVLILGNAAFITEKIIDFLFLVLSFRLIIFGVESFYRSKTSESRTDLFSDSRSVLLEPRTVLGANRADYLSFEAASLLSKSVFKHGFISGPNVFRIFPETDIGKFAFLHLGIPLKDFYAVFEESLKEFPSPEPLDSFLEKLTSDVKEVSTSDVGEIGVADIVSAILETDKNIFQTFFKLKIRKEDVVGAIGWAEAVFEKLEFASRWWLEDNLARIQGIAKDWAYGATYLLDRYSRVFSEHHPVTEQKALHFTGHQKQIGAVETILSRKAQANVLIVGEPGTGKRTVVAGLDDMINTGKIRPELEYKRILELNATSLLAGAKTKGDFESLVIRLFNDAIKAGNIILVIDNFAEFVKSVESLGISLTQTLSPYLKSDSLQLIAISDSSGYKRFLEPDSSLTQYFELVRVEEPSADELFEIIEDVSLELKGRGGILVLFQTIKEIINAATTYLTEGALPERAIDILESVSAQISGQGRNVMGPDDILAFVSTKTKMPLGVLKPEEKEKLINLEDVLHERVVNQEEAISAISAAVRRVRTGLQETKKPLGSFLFLGPTGVGKTETAKTLAEVYFGNEEAMTRFDMSEYQNENGLERLIGSFERNEQGHLATRLREKPYGLLLLDEFEKCHVKVRDLFLQILDEGFFTDAFGRRVSTRNNIIIATSNAASQLIWEMGKKGVEAAGLKESVLDLIQKEGIFKAELLNRFDAIIIFRHLTKDNLKAIAKIMLGKLKKRLFNQKEIELVINDVLLEKVAEIGYDPVFGARPMQRAIQERIEKKIAEWIISGKVDRGAKIEFNAGDLASV